MALPESRDETLVDAGPFPFTLGNSLQDQVINARHGEVSLIIPGGKVEGNLDLALSEHWNLISIPGAALSVAAGTLLGTYGPDLLIGHVIREVKLDMFTGTGAGGRVCVLELFTMDPTVDVAFSAVSTGGWGTDTSNGTTSTQDQLIISGTDRIITATSIFTARVVCDGNIRMLAVTFKIGKLT